MQNLQTKSVIIDLYRQLEDKETDMEEKRE